MYWVKRVKKTVAVQANYTAEKCMITGSNLKSNVTHRDALFSLYFRPQVKLTLDNAEALDIAILKLNHDETNSQFVGILKLTSWHSMESV